MEKTKVDFDLESEELKNAILDLKNLLRAEYNTSENYLDYYAGKDNLRNVNNITNQVIYGRRGTGKTHLLRALQELYLEKKDYFPVYIDMRKIKPLLSEDLNIYYSLIVMKDIIVEMLKCARVSIPYIFEINEWDLDRAKDIRELEVKIDKLLLEFNISFNGSGFVKLGEVHVDISDIRELTATFVASKNPEASAMLKKSQGTNETSDNLRYISFSAITDIIIQFKDLLGMKQIVILLDEWSEMPLKCQTLISELIKRAFFTQQVTTKIAAIPNRTRFMEEDGTGLEDGGDIFGYSLDNRNIYELNSEITKSFFNELLFNQLAIVLPNIKTKFYDPVKKSVDVKFINHFFANQALGEVLIASSGIPRDFINVFIRSYDIFMQRKTANKHIAVKDVREATREWYTEDKKNAVETNQNAKMFLQQVVNDIIISKKKCHFLIPEKYENNKQLNDLIDLRVIHIRKKGISHKGNKGVVYNVYYIDYACYTSANISHSQIDSNFINEIESVDDFRKIRRVSLEDDFFENINVKLGNCIKCPNCGKMIDVNHMAFIKQKMCHHCFEKVC